MTFRRLLHPLATMLVTLLFAACAAPVASTQATPRFVPANATPPTIAMASNELVGPTWQWQGSALPGGGALEVSSPEHYTLTFQAGGRVLLRADCNRGSGGYELSDQRMTMGPAATTKMGCPPGSQDAEFLRQLSAVASYAIKGNELVLTLRDGGAMRFRAA